MLFHIKVDDSEVIMQIRILPIMKQRGLVLLYGLLGTTKA